MQLQTETHPKPPSSISNRSYFQRREDLSPDNRTKIALVALYGKDYGRITRLSERFSISRTTVYSIQRQLSACIESAFYTLKTIQKDAKAKGEEVIYKILLYRLVGKCSLLAISTLLKSQGNSSHSSLGFISETLKDIGDKLPQVIDYQGTINWACDEIFHLGNVPILVSVEPRSGAILQANIAQGSLKDAWLNHWQLLREKGIYSQSLVSDEGWMLKAARLEQTEKQDEWDFQPDTFHAVSYRLGAIAKRLEKTAYQSIEAEYDREFLSLHTKQPNKLPTIKQQLTVCKTETNKAILVHENFNFLYASLLQQFNIFDNNGQVRKRNIAEQEAYCVIKLMRQFAVSGLEKELDAIEKLIPTLFGFLDKAQDSFQKAIDNQLVEPFLLPFWAVAWQYEKRSYKVKNNYKYQINLRQKSKSWLQEIQENMKLTDKEFNALKEIVFAHFDNIIQSSSAVEMFNSILRPFLNQSRDQISQHTLNLIMHYHNHKIFARGKRKGKSPFEILTGQKPNKEWIDQIMDVVRSS